MRYVVVIPVLDQLRYTEQCVHSLLAHGTPPEAILVIDNGSSDDTPEWIAAHPEIRSVRNAVNLGCGGAWTQGALLARSHWVVLLNNDVLVSDAAMKGALRRDWFHGVCFAVRRSVFEKIGFPDTDRRLGGREDVEFLLRCLRSGVPVGTVGDALLHHFGSITQKAIKLDSGQTDLGDRDYFYRRVGMGWLARKRFKAGRKAMARSWLGDEMARAGYSMHMLRSAGDWVPAPYL